MGYLLKKHQVLQINEAAADWNNSALGVLANLALKPISLITGSIKKGYKTQQLNNLVMQWAGEYAKAVKPVPADQAEEAGIPAEEVAATQDGTQPEAQGEPTTDTATTQPETEPQPTAQPQTPLPELIAGDISTVAKIRTALKTLPDNGIMDDAIFAKFKENFDEIGPINYDDYYQRLNDVLPEEVLKDILANISTYNTFMEAFLTAKSATKLKELFKTTFKSHYSSKLTEIKLLMVKIQQQFNSLAQVTKEEPKTTDTPETKKEEPVKNNQTTTAATTEKPKVNQVEIDQKKAELKNALGSLKRKPNESVLTFRDKVTMINEAKYRIPQEPNELISELDLQEILKANPNIKKEATAKVNLIKLDILLYEANYILNKSKESAADGKQGEANAELQRTWDIGIKKINDYFQSVIDVDSVMKKVKAEADQKTKDRIKNDELQITNLENMNITEVFKVGDKFDATKLYALDCSVTGLKTVSTTLIVSPTANFVDDDNATTVFWFKLLGAFKYDSATKKTVKVDIFKNISSNQKIIGNQSYFYIGLRNLRPSNNSGSYAFLYSNFGNIYYNNQEFKDTNEISSEISQIAGQGKFSDKAKNLLKVGNAFRIKINQRFNVSDEDVKNGKFPTIDFNTVNDDKNINKAKENNKKLMGILENAPATTTPTI